MGDGDGGCSPFRRGAEGREWKSGRTQLVFFKGQLQWGGGGKVVLDDGVVMYSHGVRQAMNATYGCALRVSRVLSFFNGGGDGVSHGEVVRERAREKDCV